MLNKLLQTTISQHGYWLVNHQTIIKDELTTLLDQYGYRKAAELLNDYRSPFVRGLYKKIDFSKQQIQKEMLTV